MAEPMSLPTPDGRSLDMYLAGPPDGAHDRMVPFAHGEWLAAHCGGACPHLFAEHGHLTLAVDSIPQILDELIAQVAKPN